MMGKVKTFLALAASVFAIGGWTFWVIDTFIGGLLSSSAAESDALKWLSVGIVATIIAVPLWYAALTSKDSQAPQLYG